MTKPTTAELLSAFGRRSFLAGAVFFAVVEMAARLLGWGALLTAPAAYAGSWLAYRIIDRLAARVAAEPPGAVAGATPTTTTTEGTAA